MRRSQAAFELMAAVLLLAGSSAFAQFSGYFGDYYAPANWQSQRYGHSPTDSSAFVYDGNAPSSLTIEGAVNSQGQIGINDPPASIIDYTIILAGSGLQPVAFIYSFFGKLDAYDSASLLYDNGSGLLLEVGNLATLLNDTQQSYFNNTSFMGGHRFGFRVSSNNDNDADRLTISAIPEPSTLTFLGFGLSALCWKLRRPRS
jgi:hypothetical protein